MKKHSHLNQQIEDDLNEYLGSIVGNDTLTITRDRYTIVFGFTQIFGNINIRIKHTTFKLSNVFTLKNQIVEKYPIIISSPILSNLSLNYEHCIIYRSQNYIHITSKEFPTCIVKSKIS